MNTNAPLTVLITAAGRRSYLVDWFREAGEICGRPVQVVVADADPCAPACGAADQATVLPRLDSPEYRRDLCSLLDRTQPDLFFSLNDYELALLNSDLHDVWQGRPTLPITIPPAGMQICADKYDLARASQEHGIACVPTVLGSELVDNPDLLAASTIVLKDRLGSGSSGLRILPASDAVAALREMTPAARDALVAQPCIEGEEFGVDGVFSIREEGRFVGALARRKLAMRGGETYQAVTVDPTPFQDLVAQIGQMIGARGLIDCDFIVDAEGTAHIIDVNPRFGGGYPFNHTAGAHVPACYLSELITGTPDPRYLTYQSGVTMAKEIAMRVIPAELAQLRTGR